MIHLTVNDQPLTFEGDPHMPLLWFLRDEAGLTGTKFGCGIAMCGACTVHLDGVPVRSCMTPVSASVGKKNHHHRSRGRYAGRQGGAGSLA